MDSLQQYREVALGQFVRRPVSRQMVAHLAEKAAQVIRCETAPLGFTGQQLPPTPPSTPPQDNIPSIDRFIAELVQRSQVQTATLMSTVVYLERLKKTLPNVAKGGKCTVHRIFLACLILTAKNLNDSSPKNKHWAKYSHGLWNGEGEAPFGFSLTEVNLMERQLLGLLDFNLRISKTELVEGLEPFITPLVDRMIEKEEEGKALRQAQQAQEEQERLALALKAVSTSRTMSSRSVSPQSMYSPTMASSRYVSRLDLPYPSHQQSHLPSPAPSRRGSSADIHPANNYNISYNHYAQQQTRRRDSYVSYIDDSLPTSPSSGPGLSYSNSNSSEVSLDDHMLPTPPTVSNHGAHGPLSIGALAGGPRALKMKSKNIFTRLWSRDEERIGYDAGHHGIRV